jgi:uncharacterized membrane protein
MKTALSVLMVLLLISIPYALVTFGVYLLAGLGWAMVALGLLILVTVLVVFLVAQR